MKKTTVILTIMAILAGCIPCDGKTVVINVKPSEKGDMTVVLQKAIDRAARYNGEPTEIKLARGIYNISRKEATPRLLHVSNTTSPEENPDPTKHIGLHIKGISNLTIDGGGAHIITNGEMTPWVIDSCSNITLRNFTIDASDPSLPEMTVVENTDSTLTAAVNPRSTYQIREGKLYWTGEGWEFTNGIAQIYNPADTTTLRTDSPVAYSSSVTEIDPGLLSFSFPSRKLGDLQGQTFQMRHSYRTEVAGLIWRSENITLRDIDFNFMGNFGVVAQFSSDISYINLNCRPAPESGRTGAGFADFFQVSGCKGKVLFDNCRFEGSHDDPINVHGTHLRIIDSPSANRFKVRFMHNQTFGFQAFYKGDTIAFADPYSLQRKAFGVVKEAVMDNDFEMTIVTESDIDEGVRSMKNGVIENLTWSPSVEISGCYFTLTPTRGVLMTTWRPVTINGNTFVRCPMSAILIADDALSWYESGPVRDITISNNNFIDCCNPVINISPEVYRPEGYVHENITIKDNTFELTGRFPKAGLPAINARLVKGLTIRDNIVKGPDGKLQPTLKVNIDGCTSVTVD